MNSGSRLNVLVAGGGVAGLEVLLALRDLAGDRVELTLLEPSSEFVFRPMATAETFGRGRGQRIKTSKIAADTGATLVPGALAAVDDARRRVTVDNGDELRYDALVIATGARSEPAFRRGITWTPETDPEVFGGLRRDLEEGYAHSVAFVIPPGTAWPLPAYELALMTAWDADGMGQDDVQISVVTPEQGPLAIFGPAGSAAVQADLDEAGVTVRTGAYVEETSDPSGFVVMPGGDRLDAAHVVALPRAVGPNIPGVPSDANGFIRVDRHCHVDGAERLWAAGDAIAFPVKQGGLAAQQADAAAEDIARMSGADVAAQTFKPVLRGMLLTGRGRSWMRAEITGGGGEAVAERHALWWPPTKVAGRYLAPYLHETFESSHAEGAEAPSGLPVELDLERELEQAADELRSGAQATVGRDA
ncbi:MAG TPA: FAD-dependent oxidoreductase [Thermoleophilaceae bacterium]